uniref:Uncharacterized protein n=1 Tax=Avena sativa TaxID=4498 RepID=A0ACD5YM99_AVESA
MSLPLTMLSSASNQTPNPEPRPPRKIKPEIADPTAKRSYSIKNFYKRSSGGENDRIKYGASCMKGPHDAMQDAHTTILELAGSDSTSFFGVFDGDGDGGEKVALYCSKQFHVELVRDPDYDGDLPTAMQNVYFRIDENLRRSDQWMKSLGKGNFLGRIRTGLRAVSRIWKNKRYIGPQVIGSTATVALIRDNQITVANAGDSRCVLSRNGQAIVLSTDHKPSHPDERARIVAAGGRVIRHEVDKMQDGQIVTVLDVALIDGKTAISRAIGYLEYKQDENFTLAKQKMTCNPDIRTENITGDTDFLLIASGGIWHVKSTQEVVQFVHQYLQNGGTDLRGICEELIDWCMESRDNSTVILVQFKARATDTAGTS